MRSSVLPFALALASCAGSAAPPAPDAPRRISSRGTCTALPVASARAILRDLGLPDLRLDAPARAVRREGRRGRGALCFERAVRIAVASFVLDERDRRGPLARIRRRSHRACARPEAPEMALCYLRREGARIALVPGTAGAWRFAVTAPDLSPHPFYVLVDRRLDPAGRASSLSFGGGAAPGRADPDSDQKPRSARSDAM